MFWMRFKSRACVYVEVKSGERGFYERLTIAKREMAYPDAKKDQGPKEW
jgi:hypothetical protein